MIHIWRPPLNEDVWNYCLPFLERASNYGMWTTDYYYASLESGHMALWLIDEGDSVDDPEAKTAGCFLTELRETPKGTVLWLEAVGGHAGLFDKAWDAALEAIDRFAKENDCIFIELQGRPGFLKKMKGFDHMYVTMRRPAHVQRQ